MRTSTAAAAPAGRVGGGHRGHRGHPGRRGRPLRTLVTLLTVGVLGAGAVVVALNRFDDADPVAERCTAEADGTSWHLSVTQADNAALVAGTALHRGMPARAATIGLATALQESRLVNIDYGDRDSVGLFQQRPSQGWGTVEQIMDPVYSTNAFYDVLATVSGYEQLPVTQAAQTVQRSAFPDAYAQHEPRSRAWASALTGYSAASLSCDLARVTPEDARPADAARADLDARVARDLTLGPGEAAPVEGRDAVAVTYDAAPLAAGEPGRAAWALAQWAVATADATDVVAVDVGDRRWTREDPEWTPRGEAGTDRAAGAAPGEDVAAGRVRVTVATAPQG